MTHEQYIDPTEEIELPSADAQQENGTINEPYQKKYNFNVNNLPYQLERPQNLYQFEAGLNRKQVKLNRYFEKLRPYYRLKEPKHLDTTLQFESRFESGNLKRAVKVGDFEYDLFMKNDYGTQGFT